MAKKSKKAKPTKAKAKPKKPDATTQRLAALEARVEALECRSPAEQKADQLIDAVTNDEPPQAA